MSEEHTPIQIKEDTQKQFDCNQAQENYEKNKYQFQEIADRLLRQLEDQYWEVQKHEIKPEQLNFLRKQETEEIEQCPEGYINLDNDNISDHNVNSDSQEQSQDDQIHTIQNMESIHNFQSNLEQKVNPETNQLVQVGPVPQSTFEVPQIKQTPLSVEECQKIKSFALSFEVEAPEWAKDPSMMQLKIKELFTRKGQQKKERVGYKCLE